MTQLREVMTRDVQVIHPAATIREAAEMMRDLDVGVLPVCDGRRLQGMVTDRDVVVRALADGRDPSTPVQAVMSTEVAYCFEDQDIRDAERMMGQKQIRRLVILDRDKNLAGIVSLGDVVVDTADDAQAGKTLEAISEPSRPKV